MTIFNQPINKQGIQPMEPIKAIKKQRILKRDILKFKLYLYTDKANANTYAIYDQYDSYIIRYDKNELQFTYILFKYLPIDKALQGGGIHSPMQYLREFTTFKDEYEERQKTLNPRYDESLRVQIHTERVDRKRFHELERYFNNKGE